MRDRLFLIFLLLLAPVGAAAASDEEPALGRITAAETRAVLSRIRRHATAQPAAGPTR